VAACLLNVRLALHSANVPIAGGENVVAGGFCRMIINKWAQNNAVVPYQIKMDLVGFEPTTSAMPLDQDILERLVTLIPFIQLFLMFIQYRRLHHSNAK
jgi:hypothetical protein